MKSTRKHRLKRSRAAREAKAQKTAIVTSDEDTNDKRSRFRRKRRRRENEAEEEIIDGFLIKSFKTFPLLLQASDARGVGRQINDPKETGRQMSGPRDAGSKMSDPRDARSRRDESTETSSANAREESYASSVDSTCGGYLGESEKSEGEETKKPGDEDFFRASKTNPALPKNGVVFKPKQPPTHPTPYTTASPSPQRTKKPTNVQPTASVVAVPRKSNVVTPMVTVVKPTSLQQQTQYRSLSPIRSQRLPSHRFTLPTPAMGPPASPHHNFIEQQSFLHAELNSRFLASTHPPQRHPNYHPGGLPGYENPRAYGSILNFGAFQPKPSSGIPPRVMIPDSFHKDRSSLQYRKPTKQGRWCSLHVNIARMIQTLQKKRNSENKGAFLKPDRLSSFHPPTQYQDRLQRHPLTPGHQPPPSFGGLADLRRGWKDHIPMLFNSRDPHQPSSSHMKPDLPRQDRIPLMTELTRPPPHLLPPPTHRYEYYPPQEQSIPPMLSYAMPPPTGQYYLPHMMAYYPYGPPVPHYLRPPH